MPIPSADIPQADEFQDVIRAAEAVQEGETTFQSIANYIDKVERQGRYYRRAAELLGLIRNCRNHSVLTDFGEAFFNAPSHDRTSMLLQAVLKMSLFQRMLPFFEIHPEGVTRGMLQTFMASVTEPVGPSMMPRRVTTVLNWLRAVNVLVEHGERYHLSTEIINNVPLLDYRITEPLLPEPQNLEIYLEVEQRASNASASIQVLRDQASVERANQAHLTLVNVVASRLRSAGCIPRCNQLVDLAARYNDIPYIFEMKSITPENMRSQIRRGLSQLYEYRYLQCLNDAILVLVIESPLSQEYMWLLDYLEQDRAIRLLWDGGGELYASTETEDVLSFLF